MEKLTKELERMIIHTVNNAVWKAMEQIMLNFHEEWVTEEELCRQFQMFNKNTMKHYSMFLPQKEARYRDSNGEHSTRTTYGKYAIQMMVMNDDLDFTRPDRVVYRKSKGRKKTKKASR